MFVPVTASHSPVRWRHTGYAAALLACAALALPAGEAAFVSTENALNDANPHITSTDLGAFIFPVNDTNRPPVADAGIDQTVKEGYIATLDGTASDPDGDALTYVWSLDYSGMTLSGADTLAPSFTAPQVDSDTTITFTLTVTDAYGAVSSSDVAVTVTDIPNNKPTTDAGIDQTVREGDTVTLGGTASDPDGDELTYVWSHDSPDITLSNTPAPSFTAPQVDSDTTITFTLTVTDEHGAASSDSMTVTVTDAPNSPPSADAGSDQTVREGYTATLSGTASDPDGDALTYQWSHDSNLSITLSDAATLTPSFTAPQVVANTTVTFTLTVTDAQGASTSDNVDIGITDMPANSPPSADAGSDQTVREGDTATLSGTASDPDGDALTYQWSHDSNLSITLSDSASLTPSFTAPQVVANTTVTFTLTVTDAHNLAASDTVDVVVADVAKTVPLNYPQPLNSTVPLQLNSTNGSPTADAGMDQTVQEGDAVILNGTATDPDGDPLTHQWSHDYNLTLSDSTTLTASFTAPYVNANTTIAFTLTVTDAHNNTASDKVAVTVTDNSTLPVNSTSPAVIPVSNITYNTVTGELRLHTDHNHTLRTPTPAKNATLAGDMYRTAVPMRAADCTGTCNDASGLVEHAARGWFAHSADLYVDAPAGVLGIHSGNHTALTAALDRGAVTVLNPVLEDAAYYTGNGTVSVRFSRDIDAADISKIYVTDGGGAAWFPDRTTISGRTVHLVLNDTGRNMLAGAASLKLDVAEGAVAGKYPGAAIHGLTIPVLDTTKPAFGNATYNNGTISIRFSEEIGTVNGSKLLMRDGNYTATLGDASASGDTIHATLGDADRSKFADSLTMSLAIRQGAVTDRAGNQIDESFGNKIAVRDTVRPAVLDAAYHTGNGTILILFSEDIGTVNGSKLLMRDGVHAVYLDGAAASGRTVASTLKPEDIARLADAAFLNLTALHGAARDVHGNPSDTIRDVPVRIYETGLAGMARAASFGTDDFVTTWTTASANDTIAIHVGGRTGTYTVHWGDGTNSTHSGDAAHKYGSAGSYNVSISGDFERFLAGNSTNAQKLTAMIQWGNASWTSMADSFMNARNMAYEAADAPDLSRVANMSRMFWDAYVFNGNISNWDVSAVTDMFGMFRENIRFNGDLSNWDVSSVTNMSVLFYNSEIFNGNISNWDVSKVTDMSYMFAGATQFNGNISSWDVSGVSNMVNMFASASSFNGNISSWDVSKVTDMEWMFRGADSFNGDIPLWSVSRVTDMSNMFSGATAFNGNISNWDVSKVTDMSYMFAGATQFNGNISNWDVSAVTDMSYMFWGATQFNGDMYSWDVSSVTDMSDMFYNAGAFNTDISLWDVSGVTDMSDMFTGATSFDQNLGKWYITMDDYLAWSVAQPIDDIAAQNPYLGGQNITYSLVDDVSFYDNRFFNITGNKLHIKQYNPSTIYTISIGADGHDLFGRNNSLIVYITDARDSFVTTWTTTSDNEQITIHGGPNRYTVNWGDNFANRPSGNAVHVYASAGSYNVSISGDFGRFLAGDSTNAQKLTAMIQWGDMTWPFTRDMFGNARNMIYKATDAPDLSRVSDMSNMFKSATSFNGNISNWDVSRVSDMSNMFNGATSFNGNISNWDVSKVTDMTQVFHGATSFNGDISNWDVSSATDMSWMFRGADSFNGDISNWDVSRVIWMPGMFLGATSFNGTISNWDVSRVVQMSGMFHGATSFNGDISGWDVSKVSRMHDMFRGASSFDQNLGPWYITPGSHTLVNGTTMRVGNVAAQNAYLGGQNPSYSLVSGAGDADNSLFNITGSTLYINQTAAKSAYDIRIGAGGSLFGRDNSVPVTVTVVDPPPGDFVTSWTTATADDAITIHTGGHTGTYTVHWGDGTNSTHSGDAVHTYGTPGTYGVFISGDFERFVAGNSTNAQKLTTLVQWGNASWTSMADSFAHTRNMIYKATDAPDLSRVTDMSRMFFHSGSNNANLSGWDVSGVTNMSGMFYYSYRFSGDVSGWDVSGVSDMSNMFSNTAFSGDVSGWDVSGVTNMDNMFLNAIHFNADLSGWDVSGVTDMSNIFEATAFNADISGWDVSAATYMHYMFSGATAFNADISSWDVSAATHMSGMFSDATAFNADISGWDVSNVTRMSSMFNGATSFDQNLSAWDVSRVTDMSYMFRGATSFDQNLSAWDVSSVTNMRSMFEGTAFNGDISGWDVSSVTNMRSMFYGATAFNGDISNWDVSAVTDMSYMFWGATQFNGDMYSWDVSRVTDMRSMFYGATSFDQNLGKWYITLDNHVIRSGTPSIGNLAAQNAFLRSHNPTYSLVNHTGYPDNSLFYINGSTLYANQTAAKSSYAIRIGAGGDGLFGQDNSIPVTIISPPAPAPASSGIFFPVGPARAPLTADAGPNQLAFEGDTVYLNGTAAPPGADVTFKWRQVSGPQVNMSNPASHGTSFVAPRVDIADVIALELTASDGRQNATDTVDIVVTDITVFSLTLDDISYGNATYGNATPAGGATGAPGVDIVKFQDATQPATLAGSATLGNLSANIPIRINLLDRTAAPIPVHLDSVTFTPGAFVSNASAHITASSAVPGGLPLPHMQSLLVNASLRGNGFSGGASDFSAGGSPRIKFTVPAGVPAGPDAIERPGCPAVSMHMLNDNRWDPAGHAGIDRMYATDTVRNLIHVVDIAGNNIIGEIGIAAEPRDVALNAQYLYVPHTAGVTILDTANGYAADIVDTGGEPSRILADIPRNLIYAVHAGGNVTIIDGSTHDISGNITLPQISLGGAHFDFGNMRGYLGDSVSKTILVIDLENGTFTNLIPLGRSPTAIDMDPMNGVVYAGVSNPGAVVAVNATDHTVIDIIPTGGPPEDLVFNPNNNRIYVAGPNAVSVIDARTLTLIGDIPVDHATYGMELAGPTNTIYATHPESGNVTMIDGHTDAAAGTFQMHAGIRAVAVNPDMSNPARHPAADTMRDGDIVRCSYIAGLPNLSEFAIGMVHGATG